MHILTNIFFSENVIGLDESIISEQFTLSSFSDCAKGAKDALVCTAETLRFAVAVCTCTTGTFTAAVLYIQTWSYINEKLVQDSLSNREIRLQGNTVLQNSWVPILITLNNFTIFVLNLLSFAAIGVKPH